MTFILSALVWSKANWRLVVAGLAVLAALVVAGWLYHKGAASEAAKQDKASLNALRDRSAIDDETYTLDDVALCKRAGGGAYCDSLLVDKR